MEYELTDLNTLDKAGFDAIIDVRAPSEFAIDHVPGAINLPVLSDEERAAVGTIYKQESPFKARKLGAALIAKNAARHLEGPLAELGGDWRPLVYCWRGGQRSVSFATILRQIGWRVEVLNGGYRSYRRKVVESLYERVFPAPIILLDGNTGTAKTDVIGRLAARSVQAIDLEGLAGHRGSALGGQGLQPDQKAFESGLASAVAKLDPSRPVVLEAESSRIGRLNLPPSLFEAMKGARRIEVSATVEARADYLCRAYADLVADTGGLIERLKRLTALQGRERVASWVGMAEAGEHKALASELIRHHYDPRYEKARARREGDSVVIDTDRLDEAGIDRLANRVADLVSTL